jgi:hypothetical protein
MQWPKENVQTMIYITLHRKLKDRTPRTPLKTRGELGCSRKDGTCCSTNFTVVCNYMKIHILTERNIFESSADQ